MRSGDCPECGFPLRPQDCINLGAVTSRNALRNWLRTGALGALAIALSIVGFGYARTVDDWDLIWLPTLSGALASFVLGYTVQRLEVIGSHANGLRTCRIRQVVGTAVGSVSAMLWLAITGLISNYQNVAGYPGLLLECAWFASVFWLLWCSLCVLRKLDAIIPRPARLFGGRLGIRSVKHGIWGCSLAWLALNGGCILGLVAVAWLAMGIAVVIVTYLRAAGECTNIENG